MRYLTTLGVLLFGALFVIDRYQEVAPAIFIPVACVAIVLMIAGAVYNFKNRRR